MASQQPRGRFVKKQSIDMLEKIERVLRLEADGVSSARIAQQVYLSRVSVNLYLHELYTQRRAYPVEQPDPRTGRYNHWNTSLLWFAGHPPPASPAPMPSDPWAMPSGFFGRERASGTKTARHKH